MTRQDRAWLDVDGSALRHNLMVLQQHARVPLLPMVKADSYGLGAVGVCRALGVPFADTLADDRAPVGGLPAQAPWGVGIASLDEAAALRHAGCKGRLLCATPLLARELPRALALSVRPSLHRAADILAWQALNHRQGADRVAPYHLSIDTGMARAGARWDTVADLREALRAAPPEGVFTHFHSAEESLSSRDQQDARFDQALAVLRDVLPVGVLEHRDNSGGIASRTAGSPGHLARPGIALYAGMFTAAFGLRQAAHLRARVIDVRDVLPGESVSYNATWVASGTHRIATLSAGYADGYRRHLSNVGEVLIHGTVCPVVGRVTMDMTMVDVSAVRCAPGDVATLLGADGPMVLTAEAVAGRAGVSPYELLVGLRLRVPAIHHDVLHSVQGGSV